jgi:type II secretory pathway pseudopilin PulG
MGGSRPKEHAMSRRQVRRVEGFTIVEILVVVGVLGLLIGLLLPALSGAQKKSQKLKELNALRQVGEAWMLYANSSADRAVPGFLETDVQNRWRVSFEYRNRMLIPPAPDFSTGGDNIAGPYTWRLLPFMDFNYQMVQGHVDDLYTEQLDLDGGDITAALDTANAIAYEPGFGYNAFYLGGWWETVGDQPRYRFYDATVNGAGKTVVETSIARIERSTRVITFCSSTNLPPGTYRRIQRDVPGAHYVTPPFLGQDAMWSPATEGDPMVLKVITQGAAPVGRYNQLVAVVHADNHTGLETPWSLLDMRFWLDAADDRNFRHD